MSVGALIFAYVVVTLGAIAAVSFYHEFQRRQFEPTHSEDRIFRCLTCSYVYTDDPDVDLSRCPQCGRMNSPIEF